MGSRHLFTCTVSPDPVEDGAWARGVVAEGGQLAMAPDVVAGGWEVGTVEAQVVEQDLEALELGQGRVLAGAEVAADRESGVVGVVGVSEDQVFGLGAPDATVG